MDYLALDVGGSAIKYAIIDDSYNIKEKGKYPIKFSTTEEFVEYVGVIYDEHKHNTNGLAISYCGEINVDTGYFYTGGAYPFNAKKNVLDMIKQRCNTTVTIENDANCAALAELANGVLKNCSNAMVLVLGSGIGGGLIIDKKLYRGSHYYSANASFSINDITKPYSMNNMFANLNGVGALLKPFKEIKKLDHVDGEMFFNYVNNKDQECIEILDNYCRTLASAIINYQIILDVECFAIGGGISSQPILHETLLKHVKDIKNDMIVTFPDFDIKVCKYNNDSNLIGALYHYLNK